MTTDPNEGERGDIIERLNELDRYDPKLVPLHRAAVAEITRLRAALTTCLEWIEDDEIAHGRTFGAGNEARAVLGTEPPAGLVE